MRISTMRLALTRILKEADQGLIWANDEEITEAINPYCYKAEAQGWEESDSLQLFFNEVVSPLRKRRGFSQIYASAKSKLEALASSFKIELNTK
jgi:hypothetical protein